MAEPITTVGMGAIAAYLGKDGIAKLLGPTAEYLGGELREFTQKRVQNVGKIFSKAEEKLGDNINSNGAVPPKVLKTIINEGSYCDDELAIEYFGGILASSRTELGRDDRGARVARILDTMSTYQIKAHYIIYSLIKELFCESGFEYNMDDRPKMQILIPWDSFIDSMQFDKNELEQLISIVNHSFFGLSSDNLIQTFQYGRQEHLQKYCKCEVPSQGGIIVSPSAFGAELFLWGYGQGHQDLSFALNARELPLLSESPLNLNGVKPTQQT
ncbi:TPA: hypothetical protein I7259_25120 [Vibrio parahaemolyticus]|nr:hypothetical protein [Vibrio parahaemolyticus]HAS6646872.1 hypothetical protein [Vibrio parahaemolyticus]